MILLISIALLLLIIGYLLLWFFQREKRSFGSLAGKRIYQDTETQPGYTLMATSIPLIGKPDYLIKENDMIIPVEVKTGKTPNTPYPNHIMQLMAYCFLVEEYFNVKPQHGVIRYPDDEFSIPYTDVQREAVRKIVMEILACKKSGVELHCNHPEHNRN